MKLTRLALSISLCTFVLSAQATEFSAGFLEGGGNVDLSAFSNDGYIMPGNYLLDIYLNDRLVRNRYLISALPDGKSRTVFCITPELVDMLGLKKNVLAGLKSIPGADDGHCMDLRTRESAVKYSSARQSLTITLPQAWMVYQDPDWVPPSRWSEGVNGAVLDYNLLASRYMPHQGNSSSNYSLYGTAGINLGPWRLRSDYQYNRTDNSNGKSHSDFFLPQTYLFRALPQWRSKLTLGQSYLNSAIFDAFRFTGVALASDDRMLPPSLQGYAPQITGIASGNAEVTVSQAGRVLYQTRVSPGPFVLPNLSQNISGNLDVTVRESDGSTRTWQVNTASVPFMTRKGNIRYKIAAGRPIYDGGRHSTDPDFLQAEATWGALNNTSLYGGVIASAQHYQSVALGAGQNLGELGALSVDVTRSDARLPFLRAQHQTGYSYRINYAKTFDSIGSTLAFVGYRFSDRHFMSLPEFITRSRENGRYERDEKQSYTVSYSQYFSDPGFSASLSMSRLSYWNSDPSDNWTLSLSKSFDIGSFRGLSAALSLSRNQYQYRTQNQVYASVTVPFGEGRQVSYSLRHDNQGATQHNISYLDFSHPDTAWGLSAASRNQGEGQSLSGNINTVTPRGNASADFTLQPGQYSSLGLNWYGSLTATAHGVALGQSVAGNEPRMMVDTDGIAGIPVSNGSGVTNRYGIAVVSAGASYLQSDVSVDVASLPEDVDVSGSVVNQVLTEGAIGYVRFSARRGEQVLGLLRLPDGKSPPLGAMVTSAHSGKTLGMVGDSGRVYLTGVSDEDHRLIVSWDTKKQCHLMLPETLTMSDGPLLLPCK
ncbi:fimbria/pilus outer membrane usher protein [Salmonella enterica]|nr:fimbrial biogenesis outer membrane usher protein [Salmonella enterica]EBS3849482.1 fimbrial biogenesis outer membrane usher protein [Salmonella enterica subsp. enterica serovar Java]EBX2707428.1 fimbrial biogenesis outer membrane usher protein [Salmonella enterica subsp. enterica serovar Bredeney]EDX3987482.1 fimbria/pilus outer membrane usher protein [Salmonella enterica subsp. enterica serovar 4,[5],12:b:-]EEE5612313.1 fimbria/pilus outer membrane usher protein [Salmonella enterica subsp. 